jgi:tRNA U34 5-carboxymethylaminomethyl modifying GTPase MnmE/TrmE
MNLLSGGAKHRDGHSRTTRDVVTESCVVERDFIESRRYGGNQGKRRRGGAIGHSPGAESLSDSDLVLAVFDSAAPLDENDRRILAEIRGKTLSRSSINRTAPGA